MKNELNNFRVHAFNAPNIRGKNKQKNIIYLLCNFEK